LEAAGFSSAKVDGPFVAKLVASLKPLPPETAKYQDNQ
jgi:hypothetical protein